MTLTAPLMKWVYKAIRYDPDHEDPYSPEEKVALTGEELRAALDLALGPPLIERQLNALGREGWELVAMVPAGSSGERQQHWFAILKRPA